MIDQPHNCLNCLRASEGKPVPESCFHKKATGIGYCRNWVGINGNNSMESKQA